MKDLIKRLTEAYGPSGAEEQIREIIRAEVEPYASEVTVDTLGNLVCKVKPLSPPEGAEPKRIMVAAHMDEIGVMVSYVDDKGFIRFSTVGGLNPYVLMGQKVVFANGTVGVFGAERIEDIKDLKFDKMFIDIGATSREEALAKVSIGDVAAMKREFSDLDNRVTCKAMDDRIGCAVIIEAMKRAKPQVHEVYWVFTVQEELGLRGARVGAYSVNPHVGIAVDVTGWGDTPECTPFNVVLGGGAAVKAKDSSLIAHPRLKRLMVDVAEREGIKYQLEVLERGGTDAGAMQLTREGVPAGTISIPCRYVHTPCEMVDIGDVEACVSLLAAVVDELASPSGGGIL
ncbi:MAG: M42 family metallopeptidase [Bacillota bacterium]|jgi:putative aminopeptidase FrvX|nr:M42 family metallopeptidase [Bacillota bacterium]